MVRRTPWPTRSAVASAPPNADTDRMEFSINAFNTRLACHQKQISQLSLKLDELCTLEMARAAANLDR